VSSVFVAYTSLLPTIVQVVMSLSFQVVRSALLQVTDIEFVKIEPQVPLIVQVIVIAHVVQPASHVKLNVLGLAVVKFVGYDSVIVMSPRSGPLFPYTIVYWISSPL
jgi:hypothetical protein